MTRPNTAKDVWAKLDLGAPDDCWPFLGSLTSNGYGQFYFSGRKLMAHRVAYTLVKGVIPDGLVIDHLCRNRACCNPAHLEAVTGPENTRRSPIHNFAKTTCPAGHPYAGDNLIVRKSDGARLCRTCQGKHSLAHKQRLRDRRAAQRAPQDSGRGQRPVAA